MQIRYDMVECFVVRRMNETYQFLLLRRTPGDYMGETWQTVYGGLNENEIAWQAALRELREEAGLTASELYRLDGVSMFYVSESDTLWHCVPFCAIVDGEHEVKLDAEHDAFRWLPAAEMESHLMWPSDRALAAQVRREILDNGPAKTHMRVLMNS
jgi:dATP pyrophosphohydrolase